jgi:hypothetical protein
LSGLIHLNSTHILGISLLMSVCYQFQSFAAGLQTLLQQYCDFIVRLPTQCEVEPVSSVQHANSAAPPITSPSLSHMMDALARFKARNQLHKNTFHYDTASQMGSPTPISPSSVSHSASAARLPSASSSANRFSPASPATSASPSSLSVFAARSPAQLPNQDTHKEAKELREPARVEKVPPASRGRVRSRISRNIASFGAAASQSDGTEINLLKFLMCMSVFTFLWVHSDRAIVYTDIARFVAQSRSICAVLRVTGNKPH